MKSSPPPSPDEPAPRPPREMSARLAGQILNTHNHWRRGRGKWETISFDDLPFTNEELGLALDYAIKHLRSYPLPH